MLSEGHIKIPQDMLKGDIGRGADNLCKTVSRPFGQAKGSDGLSESFSLVSIAGGLGDSTLIIPDMSNRIVNIVRRGIAVGAAVTDLYAKASGLEVLERERISRGDSGLPRDKVDTWKGLLSSAAVVRVFVTAYYILWAVSGEDTNGGTDLPFDGIPALDLASPLLATKNILYYYAGYVSPETGIVKTEKDFLQMTKQYFKAAIEAVKLRIPSLRNLESFTDNTYQLEGTEFIIHGFIADVGMRVGATEFNRISFDDIVGNEIAKKALLRLTQWMLCYDPVTKMNPAVELGAFPFILMGLGKPGTGKTILLSATVTKLTDLAKWRGIPFIFHPMPQTLVSTYQGGSAERMQEWMNPILNYHQGIGLAGIDDAEGYFLDRSREESTEGSRRIISVFLTSTEGATAIRKGNWVILFLTNLPEQIDPAVLSRIMARFEINGAETPEEFGLQNAMWMKKYRELSSGFVNLTASPGSVLVPASVQKEITRVVLEPQLERIREIFEDLRKRCSLTEERFFGEFFAAVQRRFPNFRSREARNIHSAVGARIMDFDFPPDWMDSPETFFRKEYDVKKAMIVELMRANMGKLSFADIFLAESIRHIETFAQIADTERERMITDQVKKMEIITEADKRYQLLAGGAHD